MNTGQTYTRLEDEGLSLEKIMAWLCVYLILTGSLSTANATVVFLYALFPTSLLGTLMTAFTLVVPLVLMGIGIASILPLSEYAYMKQGGTNPVIARESLRHQKKKPEKKDFGVLLGIVGLTCFLRITPWDLFFFAWSESASAVMLALMLTLLVLLIVFYNREMSKYIKFSTY
jgi:hypothetical protein